ncbi:MAG: Xaa-Pro peptidase family protein [Bacillota bacterium]|nr:Xaa-Pro peptidase family protein [Bacillota bacterium]
MDKSVFEKRYSHLQRKLAQEDIRAGLITDPVNLYYLTGWRTNPHERFTGLLVPKSGRPALVVPTLDVEAAGVAWVSDIRGWKDGENPYEVLAGAARASRVMEGSLAVEKASITLEMYEGVVEALKPARTLDLSRLLNQLRVIKGQDELELMQRAADIACKALDLVCQFIRPGVTEREIAHLLDETMRSFGADGPAFETIVLSGVRSALPHGRTGDRAIRAGDLVLIDFGAAYRGYLSDITRTFCVGPWPEDLSLIYDAVLAAHDAAMDVVGPGITMEEVDRAARRAIEERGFGSYFNHRTGHGLGLAIHEEPSFVEGNRQELEPGMVGTIEPGVYLPGVGGVRIEDEVVVTAAGSERLTRCTAERRELG